MPTPMPLAAEAIETLRQVNASLRSTLVRLHPERSLCSTIGPEDLSAIASEILRARDCLRRLSPHSEADVELHKQAFEYRDNLEKLKQLLPDLHRRLLGEKLRLQTADDHLAAIADWARANQKTL
jgi:hypothetical protein